MENQIQKLTPRHSIDKLSKAIAGLHENQIRDVKEMGFGDVLTMNNFRLPLGLAYQLFQNYDPESSSIRIASINLKITKESIKEVFGFPMGNIEVKIHKKASNNDPVIRKWQEQFKDLVNKDNRISVEMLLNVMALVSAGKGLGGLEANCPHCRLLLVKIKILEEKLDLARHNEDPSQSAALQELLALLDES